MPHPRWWAIVLLSSTLPVAGATAQLSRTPVHAPDVAYQEIIDQAEGLVAVKAIAILEPALAKAKAAKDTVAIGAVSLTLGAQHAKNGDLKKAMDTVRDTFERYREIQDWVDLAIGFMELASYEERNTQGVRLLDVQHSYRMAAEEFAKAGYHEESAFARVRMGQMWQRKGRFLPAIEAYSQVIFGDDLKKKGTTRPNGYGRGETYGLAAAASASAYAAIGNLSFANYLLNTSSLLTGPNAAPWSWAASKNECAAIQLRLGSYSNALKCAEEGLQTAHSTGHPELEAQLLFRRGVARAGLHLAGSKADFDNASQIAGDLGDEHLRAILLVEAAKLTSEPAEIRRFLGGAIDRFQTSGDTVPMIRALAGYAEAAARMGDLEEAQKAFASASSRADEIAEDFPKLGDLRIHFYREYQYLFDGLSELYIRKNDVPNVYWSVQNKKARGILDATSLVRSPLLARLSDDERQVLKANLQDIAAYGRQELAARLAEVENPVSRAMLGIREMELNSYVSALYQRHSDVSPSIPTPLADLDYLVRVLPADTALLEFAALESGLGTRIVLLVLTVQNNKVRLQQFLLNDTDGQPLTPKKFSELATGFRTVCTMTAASVKSSSTKLYRLLIQPAEAEIKTKRRLVICPDGPLWSIPFQALMNADGKYLIERFEIDYEYSASTFTTAVNRKPSVKPSAEKRVLVVANPDYGARSPLPSLPETGREAEAIRAVFPRAELLVEDKAQESEIRKRIGGFDYVHFATHALVFNDEPFLSALFLAAPDETEKEDGFLTARELMELGLNAEMVVLSACNTGNGQQLGSEGVLGLGWALFVAGSRAQVLTLWPVSDRSSAEVMSAFYAELHAGKPKGAALQAAVLSILNRPRTRHPYHWAPYFMMGDFR